MKQQLVQDQRQILSPLLVQQMEMLTLPLPELRERILEEAEKNPLIKLENPTRSYHQKYRKQSLSTAPDFVFENQATMRGLLDHVLEQIHLLGWTAREEAIAMILLTSLDKNGFLREDVSALAQGTEYPTEEMEKVRQKIMRLDPEGLASKGVLEFLIFQAEEKYGLESLEVRFLRETSDLVEKRLFSQLMKYFHVSKEELEEAMRNLAELQPVPVTEWGEVAMAIIPEAFVEVDGGDIHIRLNEYYIPEVRLDQFYLSLSHEQEVSKEDKKFFRSHLQSAKLLIENLQTRKEIVFRVVHAIIEHQRDFFLKGPQNQRPLRLRDIADELEIHESTVSRVVKDKYIQVKGKVIPLKQFFSSSVKVAGREEVSTKSIQDMISQIVSLEDKNDPLSDEQIVSILENKGIKISRRTVAKYRSIFGIPPAHARRVHR